MSAAPHVSGDKVAELRHLVQQDAPAVAAAAQAEAASTGVKSTKQQQQQGLKQDKGGKQQQQYDVQQSAEQLSSVLQIDRDLAEQLLQQEPSLLQLNQKQLKVQQELTARVA